jgi:hypothetical protein
MCFILPVRQIAPVVAEGEPLHLTTIDRERYTITYRLHLLESRLDPKRFVRLARGALANVDAISKVTPMPGGTYQATLKNGQELQVSRIQARLLDTFEALASPRVACPRVPRGPCCLCFWPVVPLCVDRLGSPASCRLCVVSTHGTEATVRWISEAACQIQAEEAMADRYSSGWRLTSGRISRWTGLQ